MKNMHSSLEPGGTDDAVPAQYEPLLFRGRVSMAFPAPTMSLRFRCSMSASPEEYKKI